MTEKHEPSEWGPGGEGRGRDTLRRGPGGNSLVSDYRSIGPAGRFRGHGVITWDPEEQVYDTFWVDSLMQGGIPARGRWEGNDLVWHSVYTIMGKKVTMKQVATDITPTSATNLFYQSIDGGEMKLVLTLNYKKMEAPQKPTE